MKITILHVNTQSIHLKLPSIKNLIHVHNPDFISIQETFLKINVHPKPSIPGFKIKDYRRPNNTARGGIILGYKENIKHSETKKATSAKNNEYIKSTFYLNNNPLTIISLYNPKSENIDIDELKTILTDTSLVVGDLNCRHPFWGNNSSNNGGEALFDLICKDNINSTFHSKPTHIHQAPPHTESMIDIALWKTNHRYIKPITPENLEDINSDHFPILFSIDSNLNKPKSTKTIHLYHRFDWTAANERIRNININDLTKNGIDNLIDELENITSDILSNIPTKTIYTSNQGLSKEIRDKLKEKKHLSRLWKRYRNPTDKRLLNRISKEIKKLISDSESRKNYKHIRNIETGNSTKYWKSFDHLFRKKKVSPITTIKDPDTNILYSDELEIANVFRKVQAQIFEGNPTYNHEHENIVNLWYDRFIFHHNQIEIFFEKGEISKKIKKLNNRKSPGPDNMSNIIIKYLEPSLTDLLYHLYNSCYNLGYFPKRWKTAKIKMLHKKEAKSDPLNYRPISLLNQLGKILESLMTDIIYFWAEDLDKLDLNQSGFRKKRSTNDQLYTLIQTAFECFNRKKQIDCIFIDFEKAFDKIWHKGLLYKLKALRLPNSHIHMIKSFLSDRTCYIQNGDSKSDTFSPKNGVPQGSCLSPLLFILYMIDVPTNPKVKQTKFADDLTLFTYILAKAKKITNPDRNLQSLLNELMSWCRKWKMKINITKTKKMTFTRCLWNTTDTIYYLDNHPIEHVKSIKFLGITLDPRLTLGNHIEKKIGQASSKIHYLSQMNQHGLSTSAKRRAYVSLIRTILEYGSGMLCALNKENFKKLELFQNRCLRLITNSRRSTKILDMLELSKLTSIETRIKTLGKKWLTQAKANPKNIVYHIREVSFGDFDTYKTPHSILTSDPIP